MVYADLVEDLLKDPGLMTRFSYDVIIDTMTTYQPYIHGKGSRGRVDTWQQIQNGNNGDFCCISIFLLTLDERPSK